MATSQYAPGRHRETGCDSLSLSSNKHLTRQTNSASFAPEVRRSDNVSTFQPTTHNLTSTTKIKNNNKTKLNSIRIGTINVQTAKDEIKLAEYITQVKNLQQETHKIGIIELKDPALNGWKIVYSGFKRKAQAGVAIVLAPHAQIDDVLDVERGRILGARIILSIFSCYAPTDTKSYSDDITNTFYTTLRKSISVVKKDHPSYKLVVGGDFNVTVGNLFQMYWQE